MLPKELLDVLVCPQSKGKLVYFPPGADDPQGFLLCPASRLRYRIESGVPVMLVDEATEVAPDVVEQLISRARELGIAVP